MKPKYTYMYDECGYHTTFDTTWDSRYLEYIAEDAAEHFFYTCEGWDATWPITFEIFKNEALGVHESIGKVEVDLEYTPAFMASPV
jgi:hypothetical protein